MKQQSRATLFALLSVLLWSTVATAFKLGLKELSPLYLILTASAVSLIVFFVVIIGQGKVKDLFAVFLAGLGTRSGQLAHSPQR